MQQMQSSGSSIQQLKHVQMELCKRSSNRSSPAKDHVSSFHLTSNFLLSKRNRAAIFGLSLVGDLPGFFGTSPCQVGSLKPWHVFRFGPQVQFRTCQRCHLTGGRTMVQNRNTEGNKIVCLVRQAVCHYPGRSTRGFLGISARKSSKIRLS